MLGHNPDTPVIDSTREIATPSAAAAWSDRARIFQRLAMLFGIVVATIGGLMFLTTNHLVTEDDILNSLVGLVLFPFGLCIIYVTVRSQAEPPDQAYTPLGITMPRRWFLSIWIIGLILYYLVLAPGSFSSPQIIFAIVMGLAAGATLSGALWCLRWLAGKYATEWPLGRIDAPAPISLRWPRNWNIAWVMLAGGLISVLAGFLETLTFQFFAPVFEDAAMRAVFTSSRINSFNDASFVASILLIFAVIAPIIEEACKALILRLFRKSIERPSDGVLLGMAAGLGFGMVESLLYMFSMFLLGVWWIGAWGRVATILMHGTTTSIIGLAYARSLRFGDRRILIGGYFRAVMLHGLWNGLFFAAVFVAISGQTLLGCGGFIVWLIVMSRQLPRIGAAAVEASVQDQYIAANLPMPPDWSPMDDGFAWKVVGSQPKYVDRTSAFDTV